MTAFLDFASEHWIMGILFAWFSLIAFIRLVGLLRFALNFVYSCYDRALTERQFADLRDLRCALTEEFGIRKTAELVRKYPALSRGYDRWHEHCTEQTNKPDIKLVA
jgi:hypothetical protein